MDFKNVRLLQIRPENNDESREKAIFIDEKARAALCLEWGSKIKILGRKTAYGIIHPLCECDQDAQVARAHHSLLHDLMVEIGEEVLLVGACKI